MHYTERRAGDAHVPDEISQLCAMTLLIMPRCESVTDDSLKPRIYFPPPENECSLAHARVRVCDIDFELDSE